jgi:hypothetical protein
LCIRWRRGKVVTQANSFKQILSSGRADEQALQGLAAFNPEWRSASAKQLALQRRAMALTVAVLVD